MTSWTWKLNWRGTWRAWARAVLQALAMVPLALHAAQSQVVEAPAPSPSISRPAITKELVLQFMKTALETRRMFDPTYWLAKPELGWVKVDGLVEHELRYESLDSRQGFRFGSGELVINPSGRAHVSITLRPDDGNARQCVTVAEMERSFGPPQERLRPGISHWTTPKDAEPGVTGSYVYYFDLTRTTFHQFYLTFFERRCASGIGLRRRHISDVSPQGEVRDDLPVLKKIHEEMYK